MTSAIEKITDLLDDDNRRMEREAKAALVEQHRLKLIADAIVTIGGMGSVGDNPDVIATEMTLIPCEAYRLMVEALQHCYGFTISRKYPNITQAKIMWALDAVCAPYQADL